MPADRAEPSDLAKRVRDSQKTSEFITCWFSSPLHLAVDERSQDEPDSAVLLSLARGSAAGLEPAPAVGAALVEGLAEVDCPSCAARATRIEPLPCDNEDDIWLW